MENDKIENDVFLGNYESYSKKELADVINFTLNTIHHLAFINSDEQSTLLKILGKKIYEYLSQLNDEHINQLQSKIDYIDSLEASIKEKIKPLN